MKLAAFIIACSCFAPYLSAYAEEGKDLEHPAVIQKDKEQKAYDFLYDFLLSAQKIAIDSMKSESDHSNFGTVITKDFDLSEISYFILGSKYYESLSEEQKNIFKKSLSRYFIKIYGTKEKVDLFSTTTIDKKSIKTKPSIKNGKRGLFIEYKANFTLKDGSQINAVFTLKKEGDGSYKIYDIELQGFRLTFGTRDQIKNMQKNAESTDAFLEKFSNFVKE